MINRWFQGGASFSVPPTWLMTWSTLFFLRVWNDPHLTALGKQINTQILHVWNIYLHLGHFWVKCRSLFHTWSSWDIDNEKSMQNQGSSQGRDSSIGLFANGKSAISMRYHHLLLYQKGHPSLDRPTLSYCWLS